MTFTSFKNARIVRSGWLNEGGRRLDCNPYMSGALEARDTLRRLSVRKDSLSALTSGHDGGIYNGPVFARVWVDDARFGVRFLSGSDVLTGDLSSLPLLKRSYATSSKLSHLELQEGMTLITCSGTIGRMSYVRPDMVGIWSSQHIMKILPSPERIPPGYLYAFLSSRYGVPLIVSGTYGAIIQHIEPEHISDLPVPRWNHDFEEQVHLKVDEAAKLLSRYQRLVTEATDDLFASVGLKDISATDWHKNGPNTAFSIDKPNVSSLRALNFNPRFKELKERIQRGPAKSLEEICLPGTLIRGNRFKRIDAQAQFALKMVGQKELFWLKPEGRLVAKTALPDDAVLDSGSIVVAARGTLGENELYCRAEFVWGPWTELAFSEDILRIIADEAVMPRGCLFAFMRSETAFRMLRSISTGSKLQDHHYRMRGELPVPYPDREIQLAIHNKVVAAYEARHKAVALMDEATQLVEEKISRGSN